LSSLCDGLNHTVQIVMDPASEKDPRKPLSRWCLSLIAISLTLDRLSCIFRYTNVPADRTLTQHPCLKAAQDTWALISVGLTR
jgi:hypothetical protein